MNLREQAARRDLVKQFPKLLEAVGPASEQFEIVKFPQAAGYKKTWAMRMAEQAAGMPLEELLSRDKRGSYIAEKVGLSQSCICRWRKALGL